MSTVSYHYHPHIIEEQKQAEAAFLAQFESGAYPFEAPLVLGNPYLIAPLTALVLFRLPEAQAVTVTVKGKTPQGDMTFTSSASAVQMLPIYGL